MAYCFHLQGSSFLWLLSITAYVQYYETVETSSTDVHGSSAVIDDVQIQKVTDDVKAVLSLCSAVTEQDGEHAVKELHHSIIDAVYAELLRQIGSKSEITEAVRAQTQDLWWSPSSGPITTDTTDLYHSPSVPSGSSPSKSDTKVNASLVTLLALRVVVLLGATSSDLTKEVSWNDPELIERILREFSASSSAAKLEEKPRMQRPETEETSKKRKSLFSPTQDAKNQHLQKALVAQIRTICQRLRTAEKGGSRMSCCFRKSRRIILL
ncbi:hypothetical protein AOLI_G00041790 [Acnodon oligacanthus]